MSSILVLVKLQGKKRLYTYTEEERHSIVRFLLERMLTILEGMPVYVGTPDDIPGTIVRDEWGDINRVITKARELIQDDLLILPCDLPIVEKADVEELCKTGVVRIVPSRDGGTNALFLPSGVDIKPQFGENSFENHKKVLESQGITYEVYESERFRDVDTTGDIEWVLEKYGDSAFAQFIREQRLQPKPCPR